jgi:NADH-quinone oxidoreductase subunit J
VTLASAAGIIFLKQPVHSLLCLITVFFATVLLYVYTGAEFLAFLFLIVYVGAIAILFLFVIMLLNLKELTTAPTIVTTGAAAIFFPSVIITCIGIDDTLSYALTLFFVATDIFVFKREATSVDALIWYVNNRFSDILTFSSLLYTYHCFLFFLAGLLLLTAMLGAIILATSATDSDEKIRR